ncbi:unnamed protein product [Rotaria sordida]|uniref:Uncharacterized protein n=1 Tax=Rotaria sordida TaxID=392033 RepID=A0A815KRJ0_9BILA|nr:unnamed protein product [Rotaria sordida]
MNNHIGESSTTTKTFRFNSGQLLTLNECQIEKIPYLTALVSAGPYFDSIEINEGYYLLDSRINYEDFQFVLESISFHSVRQIFIDLPKNYNILAIIALLDFIGIKPVRCPTLEEIDSSFFWNLECGDTLGTYQLIYKSSDAKDMAVRFAIALAKEEYDFRNRTIIDQIYWFIMFILSAYELFETNLRYHVCKIAENYFSIFCPSLLKCLYRLERRTEKEIQEKSISTSNHINPYQENNILWDLNTFNKNCTWHVWDDRDEDLEPICNKVLKYMYKCLLSTVLEQVSAKTPDHKFDGFDPLQFYPWITVRNP